MSENRKKLSKEEKDHKLRRLRPMMSLDELNEISKELKSDEDFVEHTLEHIKTVTETGIVTVFGTTAESPREELKEDGRSFAFFRQPDAVEYVQTLLDAGTINSKPREVMQKGFGRMRDKYLDLKEMEEHENSIIREFCEPSFDEICNNIWVNGYNGLTYNTSEEDIPEEAKQTAGVIVPGIIENHEDYIDFVRRLKDKGKHGLGRAIFDRYEDYEEAKYLIDQYKEALYQKYGGKDAFFQAKELGGVFGAYEYFPLLEPKYKKSVRNRRLAKGLSLNPLAYVKDMGSRIRNEHEDEFKDMDTDNQVDYYEQAPPKFRDLPAVFQQVYKLDENGERSYDTFRNNMSYNEVIRDFEKKRKFMSSEEIDFMYELIEELAYEEFVKLDSNYSTFVDTMNGDESSNIALANMAYNKLMDEYETYKGSNPAFDYYESAQDYADSKMLVDENKKAFKEFVKSQIKLMNGINDDEVSDLDKQQLKTMTDDAAAFAADMMYDEAFRRRELAKREMNKAAETIAKARGVEKAFGSNNLKDKFKEEHRAGDGPVEGYLRRVNSEIKTIISNAESNADSGIYRNAMSTKDITGGTSYDDYNDGGGLGFDTFNMKPTITDAGKYIVENIDLAKKVAELSRGEDDTEMFGFRVSPETFLENASKPSKPLATKESMEENMEEVKRRKGLFK